MYFKVLRVNVHGAKRDGGFLSFPFLPPGFHGEESTFCGFVLEICILFYFFLSACNMEDTGFEAIKRIDFTGIYLPQYSHSQF